MDVLLMAWSEHFKKSNGRYDKVSRPVIIEDHPEDQGRKIAEFGRIEDAIEYIQFKGFRVVHSEWEQFKANKGEK